MKLIDLNPSWLGHGGDSVFDSNHNPVPRREAIGINLDCPCGCSSPLFVPFKNPLDGGPPYAEKVNLWNRTGETFENLTLTPSILRIGGCGWHGFITNGEIINA